MKPSGSCPRPSLVPASRRLPASILCSAILSLVFLSATSVTAEELLPPDRPMNEVIDHYIEEGWKSGEIQPAPEVPDNVFIRRLTLDLAGRIPTKAEVEAYRNSTEPDKKQKLVDRLLESPDWIQAQANWVDALLLAQIKRDDKWRDYLVEAVKTNRGWDQMFREMMLADEQDGKPEPALEFLRSRVRDIDNLTNDTTVLFFGVAISCARCHDHPLVDDWKQDHYFGMASFFNRTYMTRKNTLAEKSSGSMKFKTTQGEEKEAGLMFLTGDLIDAPKVEKTPEEQKAEEALYKKQMEDDKLPQPEPPQFSPRQKFVEIALQGENARFFTRNIVNRTWARLTGTGMVEPLEQMHSDNPASHPELMDWLVRDLVEHNYDLKRLVRGIVLSRVYALSSEWTGPGEKPFPGYFAVGNARVLTPRQYALSLTIARDNPEQYPLDVKPEDWEKRRNDLERNALGFAGRFEWPSENFQVSVDEALMFNNDQNLQNDYLRDDNSRLVGYLKKIENPEELITTAYQSILSRSPEAEELQVFKQYLQDREDRRVEGIQQIVWALLTSPEMRFNY